MKLSAPIFLLKRRAKLVSREDNVPLHEALDGVAIQEGFGDWSSLAARYRNASTGNLLAKLRPGDLMLLGARPRQGKTLMSLALTVEAMKRGRRSFFFSLESTEKEIRDRFPVIGADYEQHRRLFEVDCSDAISADYITTNLASVSRNTLAIVDYLQLLDQRREHPEVGPQVRALKSFAQDRGVTFVFLSQIDRSYDPTRKSCPDIQDVRLPNPLDLRLFDKTCFINESVVRFQSAG